MRTFYYLQCILRRKVSNPADSEGEEFWEDDGENQLGNLLFNQKSMPCDTFYPRKSFMFCSFF